VGFSVCVQHKKRQKAISFVTTERFQLINFSSEV